jgi:nucleoside-diphosphate-sugar epimerase
MATPAPAEAPPRARAVVMVTGSSGLVGRALRDAVEAEQAAAGSDADEITAARWVWLSSADGDLCDAAATAAIFERHAPSHVIHLAARVGGLFANLVRVLARAKMALRAVRCARARRRLTRVPRACAAQNDNLGFFTQNCAMCAARRGAARRCRRA